MVPLSKHRGPVHYGAFGGWKRSKNQTIAGLSASAGFQAGCYFVAGDIGGTNARLQLFSHQVLRRRSELIFEKFYASGRYPSLTVILELFLREADHETAWNVSNENWPVYACLAVAGPVYNNECSFTNIPSWPRLVGKDMARDLNIPEVALINDFLAVAFGILKLTPGDYTQLNP
eukprot:g30965.t1